MPLPLLFGIPLWMWGAGAAGTAAAGTAIGAARRSGKTRNPLLDDEDADLIDEGDPSLLSSVGEAIGRPGKIINNALVGNFEGAGRQLVDLGGDIVDAFLPGDWIPHISRRQDKPEFSDVVGGMEPGFGKFAVDVLGGATTDPLTYAGGTILKGAGSLAGKAGSAAARVIEQLPKGEKALEAGGEALSKGGEFLRKTAGAQRTMPETKQAAMRAGAATSNVREAGTKSLGELLKGASAADQTALGEIGHNIRLDPATKRPIGLLDESETLSLPERARIYLETAPPGVNRELVQRVADELPTRAKTQFTEGQGTGMGGGIFTEGEGVGDYFPRQFSGKKWSDVDAEKDAFGRTKAYKGRKLERSRDVLEFMQNEPGVSLEFNAAKALGSRAEQEAMLAGKAAIGQHLVGEGFKLADPAMVKQAEEGLADLAARGFTEDAQVLGDLFRGLPQRGPVTNALAKSLTPFKKFAVYGALIPKIGTDVSNALSGVWQTMANAEARGQVGTMVKQLVPTVLKSLDDGLEKMFGMRFSKNEFAQLDEAARQSGGSVAKMHSLIKDPMMREAVQNGVIGNNFVTMENLINETARTGWKKWAGNWWDMPGTIFKGVEQRMRFALYKGLRKTHKPADAARITQDTLFDYNVSSNANRTARDIIPFFQFQAKAIPQSAKFFGEVPAAATAVSRAIERDPDEPVLPHMEGKINVPLGLDEEGNQSYAANLRLPFESLNMIPNFSADLPDFGRQFEQNVVGSSSPLLKSAFGAVAGEDPYFGTPYGSYDRIPAIGEAGDLGQAYNQVAGTGLIQPVDSFLRSIGELTDERYSPGVRALDFLTGTNVVSVDPDRALQLQLQEELENNPDVKQFRSFYQTDEDPETMAMLQRYLEAKKRSKAKRALTRE